MKQKLTAYVEAFHQTDQETVSQLIPNREAARWLAENIPLLDCPDPELEEIYYFRWWTFRKHWKLAEDRHILTEFLPQVPWSGPFNAINCPSGFHIREGRWLRDREGWLKEYLDFWLDSDRTADPHDPADGHGYSVWYGHATWEYCVLKHDFAYGIRQLPKLVDYFRRREARQRRACGLYWSDDDRDGMEYSISGSGLRPTLNTYVLADAAAIARLAELAGDRDLAAEFRHKADAMAQAMEQLLWDGDFYRAIPLDRDASGAFAVRPSVPAAHRARELVGYLPWYFGPQALEKDPVFRHLLDPQGFAAPYGLTTAEQRHPRFMEKHDHECLWNGPVWPFATSQTLVALANRLQQGPLEGITANDYYALLLQYARSHHRINEQGLRIPWIDENLHPFTGHWLAREILEAQGWPAACGGCERGKDYNHSLFCDLVLSGLLGIGADTEGKPTVSPLLPDHWTWFRVAQVSIGGRLWTITYDKDGSHYGQAPGITIQPIS